MACIIKSISCLAAVLLTACSTPQEYGYTDPPRPGDPTARLEACLARSEAPPLNDSRRWLDESKWATTSLSLVGAVTDGGRLFVFFDIGERIPISPESATGKAAGSMPRLVSWFEIPFWTTTIVINDSSDPINEASRPRTPKYATVQWADNPVHLIDEVELAGEYRLTRYSVEYYIPKVRAGDTVHLQRNLQGFFLDMAAFDATQAGRDHLTNMAVVGDDWENPITVR